MSLCCHNDAARNITERVPMISALIKHDVRDNTRDTSDMIYIIIQNARDGEMYCIPTAKVMLAKFTCDNKAPF